MSFFLPRIIGYSRAMDLIFTSRYVMGPEALELGLLNRLVEHDQLLDESLALANQIVKWPPVAMRSAKRTVQRNLQVDLDTALFNESVGLGFSGRAPHDAAESRASFIDQRNPHFTGQ
jgi:enoyl-CoA hydratase/carnithine racemase